MGEPHPPPADASGPIWRRLARGFRRVRQAPDWEDFAGADWVGRIMAEAVPDRFHAKQGRSIGRWTLHHAGRTLTVYLKRHYRLPRWRGLMAALLPRRAWSPGLQEWEHLAWAAAQGLPVPRPVAAGEFVGPWGRLQSFLAVEELDGMLPLHEAIPLAQASLDPSAFHVWKRGLGAEMARLAGLLHGRRVFHKDLYLCHFYVPADDCKRVPGAWPGRVFVIDLHRLAPHPWTALWWRVKDLAQLLYSSEVPGVTARDRLGFWRAYRGGRAGLFGRWLARAVRAKWRLYRRHNRKNGE